MAIAKPLVPVKVTFDEYLARAEGIHAEWVEGEIAPLPAASTMHQLLVVFLTGILDSYVRERDLGVVLVAPWTMRLDSPRTGREPDLLFVAKEHEDRMSRTHLNGPADLAIEILSIESRERDRVVKYAEYERAGVREYWILDADARTAAFFQLGEDGRYTAVEPDAAGIYRSAVILGLWIDVRWLWERPRQIEVLRNWGLLA